MMGLMLIFVSLLSLADPTFRWNNSVKIVDRHEFYTNNEVIKKPRDSWQTLFAVLYRDTNLTESKDCVFYRVPGEEPGILKIKILKSTESCEAHLFNPGDEEWKGLKALQFAVQDNFLALNMTDEKFQVTRWDIALFNAYQHPEPKIFMSSAEYRAPKLMFLNPYKGQLKVSPKKTTLKLQNKVCHEVTEDCSVKGPSTCSQCPNGWYEIPNGCPQGPKFCGSLDCGEKNQPACRRGMKYQKKELEFSCRDESSFAYCAKGLRIQCQGVLPYCI